MLGLGKRMFPLLALALELDESFFDDKVSTECSGKSPSGDTDISFLDTVPCRHSTIVVLPTFKGEEGK